MHPRLNRYPAPQKVRGIRLFEIRRASGPRRVRALAQFLRSSVPVPFGYWTPVLESRRIPFMVSWAGCLGRRCVPPNGVIMFLAVQKSTTKSVTFFIDFGSQNRPQIHPEITKKRVPNQSRNQSQKKTKIFCSRALQSLKIELAFRRGAIFHKTAVFEKLQKTSKFMSKQLHKSLKFSKKVIQKSNQKTTRKTA